jgi:hypothetical protein
MPSPASASKPRAGTGPLERVAIAQLGEEELETHRRDLRWMRPGQMSSGASDNARAMISALTPGPAWRFGRRELASDETFAPLDRDRHQAGLLFEGDHERPVERAQLAEGAEDEGRADVRMAGERQFGSRGEDSHPARVPPIGREHEGGLREVELAGDLLHSPVRQAGRLGEHGELVATEPGRGEDVAGDVAVAPSALVRTRSVNGSASARG